MYNIFFSRVKCEGPRVACLQTLRTGIFDINLKLLICCPTVERVRQIKWIPFLILPSSTGICSYRAAHRQGQNRFSCSIIKCQFGFEHCVTAVAQLIQIYIFRVFRLVSCEWTRQAAKSFCAPVPVFPRKLDRAFTPHMHQWEVCDDSAMKLCSC